MSDDLLDPVEPEADDFDTKPILDDDEEELAVPGADAEVLLGDIKAADSEELDPEDLEEDEEDDMDDLGKDDWEE